MRMNQLPVVIQRKIPSAQLPVQYEQACKDLVACTTIDEAKFWDNKADALAAWAKMFKDEKAAVAAKRLKLHAYRRMGELAHELRPHVYRKGCPGSSPGPSSLLKEQGLTANQASAARALALVSKKVFDTAAKVPNPPTPRGFQRLMAPGTSAWKSIFGQNGVMLDLRSKARKLDARQLAKDLMPDEIGRAREMIRECIDWLDELERHLSKPTKPSAAVYRAFMAARS